MQLSACPSRSQLSLDAESQALENAYRAGLPALEIAGAKAPPRGKLICCAQNRLRRVTAIAPDQFVSRGWSETMLREELLRTQPIILTYCAQHVTTGDAIPYHHAVPPRVIPFDPQRSHAK